MKLIDYPRHVYIARYERALGDMVNKISRQPGVAAIYQIGGISAPGISDIDLCVLFNEGKICRYDPLAELSSEERYLFIHNVYGMTVENFQRSQRFVFFHDYKHLWGKELEISKSNLSSEETRQVNIQAGLEYLIKQFISMTVERTYGILKVRGLLLHVKALVYDFEYLGISSGRLIELLRIAIAWRASWFNAEPDGMMLAEWFEKFYKELRAVLGGLLDKNKFYVPRWAGLQIAGNMKIIPSNSLDVNHRGILLPMLLSGIGKKYFNLQHRFNRFEFQIPLIRENVPGIIMERHEFITCLNEYNAGYLPYFTPVAYGLPIFNRQGGN